MARRPSGSSRTVTRLRAKVLPAQSLPLNATDLYQPCASMLGRLLRRWGRGIPTRRERCAQHRLGWGQITPEDDKQSPPDQAKILEKLPEVLARWAAVALDPKIGVGPEGMVQNGSYHAEAGKHKGRDAIVHAGHDQDRRDELDDNRQNEHRLGAWKPV